VVPKRPSGPEGIPTEAKDAAAPIERRGGTGSAADGPSLKSNLPAYRRGDGARAYWLAVWWHVRHPEWSDLLILAPGFLIGWWMA
jgi:hypothetical protein